MSDKKRGKHSSKPSHKPSKQSAGRNKKPAPKAETQPVMLWLAEGLLALPRMGRVALTLFLSAAVTFASFPLLWLFFFVISRLTGSSTLLMDYIFTPQRGVLNFLVGISLALGGAYYIIGWRVYVGTVGEMPSIERRVVFYFLTGALAVVITAVWLVVGVLVGTAPVPR